mmetsp:Transcript_16792/g.25199  ORF Transcript_16792/g.25199 Transcript_16792/m.25199 type:complete len:631 (+) Transcript_16792:38-1930(+)
MNHSIALSIIIAALHLQNTGGFSVTFPRSLNQVNLFTPSSSSSSRTASSSATFVPNVVLAQRNSQSFKLSAKKKDEEEEEEYEYEYVEVDAEEDEDAEYEYVEVDEDAEEEFEEEDAIEVEEEIPLTPDPDDDNYNAQMKLIGDTIARREALAAVDEELEGPDSTQFFKENLEKFMDEEYEKAGLDDKEVQKYLQKLQVTEEEAEEAINESAEEAREMSYSDKKKAFLSTLGGDEDSFPEDGNPILQDGIKNEDLVRLQKALDGLVGTIEGYQDGSLVDNKQAMIRPHYELDKLDRETLDEISLVLNASATDANGIEYNEFINNEDPTRWLLYDLDFDVANLMLASCKHNRESPLILNHWMPQLCAYSRYADARDSDFQFTWEECEKADMDELLRYYKGLGYDEIPTFTPKDTNIVELETEYDQADMTMAAFENWMDEVYIEDDEDLYFDDEDFQPENNVFDFNYGMEDTDDVTSFKTELKEFHSEHRNETKTWKNKYVRETNYTYVKDADGSEQFRGHLVVACCGSDHDLALAEKITFRMKEQFDKQLYVETRVYSHARQEDNLYEIWLESYDIELLHSRRGAFYNAKQWLGPADVDDEQLENLVGKIEHCIGDDARYSYHLHEFVTEV